MANNEFGINTLIRRSGAPYTQDWIMSLTQVFCAVYPLPGVYRPRYDLLPAEKAC